MTTESWTSVRGTGVTAVRLHLGQDNFRSWLELSFKSSYSRDEKGRLVEEYLDSGSERGAFPLPHLLLPAH